MSTEILCKDLKIAVNFQSQVSAEEVGTGCIAIAADWDKMTVEQPQMTISWQMPLVDIQYMWYPGCGKDRRLRVDWEERVVSRMARSAPVFVFFNAQSRNRMTLALSDVFTEIQVLAGVREENGMLVFRVQIPLDATGLTDHYEVKIYRSDADVSFAETLRRASRWWERDCGLIPMRVPDEARQPMYSTWYSYHQATIAREIEAECAEAAKLGMKTVIVDDGWQTDDGNRGYGFCGDWEPTGKKIPDMAAHVQRIQELGMKYMLWYSVPFIGKWSKNWERFKDKLSNAWEPQNCAMLDPRYPEVREFLIETYENALKNWDLDGFKLDFIDSFPASSRAPLPAAGMDYVKMEDAILRLMVDVMNALKAIKPDIMIEFRQGYIGPAMRTFGNIFRVSDCPADPITNRVGMVDLRLLSGDTAVHSDMLMWHREEPVEAAARQMLNVLFAVPQISVRLKDISEEHKRMVTFWTRFIIEHQQLLRAPMEVEAPEMLYPLVRTRLAEEEAVAVYAAGHVAALSDASLTYLFNATAAGEMVVKCDADFGYCAKIYNCMGELTDQTEWTGVRLQMLNVPVSGYALIECS